MLCILFGLPAMVFFGFLDCLAREELIKLVEVQVSAPVLDI